MRVSGTVFQQSRCRKSTVQLNEPCSSWVLHSEQQDCVYPNFCQIGKCSLLRAIRFLPWGWDVTPPFAAVYVNLKSSKPEFALIIKGEKKNYHWSEFPVSINYIRNEDAQLGEFVWIQFSKTYFSVTLSSCFIGQKSEISLPLAVIVPIGFFPASELLWSAEDPLEGTQIKAAWGKLYPSTV